MILLDYQEARMRIRAALGGPQAAGEPCGRAGRPPAGVALRPTVLGALDRLAAGPPHGRPGQGPGLSARAGQGCPRAEQGRHRKADGAVGSR